MRLFVMFSLSLRLCASSFNDIEPSTPDEIASLQSDLLIDGYVSNQTQQEELLVERMQNLLKTGNIPDGTDWLPIKK